MKTRQSTQFIRIMRYSLLTLSAAIMLSSCGGNESTDETSSTDSLATDNATAVTASQLQRADFSHFFTVQGLVEADQNAQLFPEAAGKITAILVKEGDNVSKGQTLLTIDSKIVANQINELQSRLSLAKLVYEKQESLWSQEIGSEIQYLEAKNNFESLESSLETLEAQKSHYVITAPFAGIVDEINPKVGEMANPAMPAFRLINMKSVYVKADVTEGYLGKINEGDVVTAAFPSMNYEVETKIKRIGNYINPNNRTFKVTLELPNSNNMLRPNLLAEISVRDYHSDSTVVIPTSLVQLTPSGQEFVYAIEGGIAKKIEITTGKSYMNNVEVLEGLNGNEMLIERGARSVKDGDEVSIQS